MKLIVPQIEIKEIASGCVKIEVTSELFEQDSYSMLLNEKDLDHVHYALGKFIEKLKAKG